MKKILLLAACALLCPMHMMHAADAEEVAPVTRRVTQAAPRTTTKKPAAKKPAAKKASPKKTAAPRTQTTTAGRKTTAAKATKKPISSQAKKTTAARAKTTTAGTKAKTVKRTTGAKPKGKATTAASRAKKTTYGTKPAAKKSVASKNVGTKRKAVDTNKAPNAKRTAAQKATASRAVAGPKVKRVYRKGGVTYRKFDRLNTVPAQSFGNIGKEPLSQTVSLNEPGRGYKNANHITFRTADGKEGQLVLDSHNLTPERALKKGIKKVPHVGQKSVEVFAGTDAPEKGLARIGEFPLLNANLKGTDDLQISVAPNGQVLLSSKDAASGRFVPITEFSIHQ